MLKGIFERSPRQQWCAMSDPQYAAFLKACLPLEKPGEAAYRLARRWHLDGTEYRDIIHPIPVGTEIRTVGGRPVTRPLKISNQISTQLHPDDDAALLKESARHSQSPSETIRQWLTCAAQMPPVGPVIETPDDLINWASSHHGDNKILLEALITEDLFGRISYRQIVDFIWQLKGEGRAILSDPGHSRDHFKRIKFPRTIASWVQFQSQPT